MIQNIGIEEKGRKVLGKAFSQMGAGCAGFGGGVGLGAKLCPTLVAPRTVACQARILEWVAISFSLSRLKDHTNNGSS